MINLRYHIMSLIAVLLALVLGVAAGSAVVDKGLVNQLEGNLDRLDHNLNEASKTNDRLTSELKDLKDVQRQFDQEAGARYLGGILLGVPVLLVAVRGVDEGAVSDLSNALTLAGGEPQATVWIEPKAALLNPDDAGRLAQLLGVPSADVPTLHQELADHLSLAMVAAMSRTRITTRAVEAAATTTTTPATTTTVPAPGAVGELVAMLDALRQAGFISVDRDKGISTIDLTGGVVVMVDSVAVPDAVQQPAIALARELALHPSIPTVVTEIPSDPARGVSLVQVVLSDDQMRARLSTVDDARSLYGWTATALAAAQILNGTVGHYGHGKGADSLLPAPTS